MSVVLAWQKPDLDDLAHFGVKGQKWGVRKQKTTSESTAGGKKQPMSTKKKVAIGVGAAVVVAAGAYAAHRILGTRGNIPVSKMVSSTPRPEAIAAYRKKMSNSNWEKELYDNVRSKLDGEGPRNIKFRVVQKQYHSVSEDLKPGQFMRYSTSLRKYVADDRFGWNPNTGETGKSMIRELGFR